METKIKFPSSKLDDILDWKERYIVLYGGRGSSKSWSIALILLVFALSGKFRILCTREIQRTIRDSVHKLLSDTIDRLKWNNFFNIKIDSIKSVSGSEFIFKGLHNNPDDIKSLEGIDIAWVEEAQRVSRRSLETLIPTIRKDNSRIYFSYNPTNKDDPVHVDYNLSDRPDVRKVELNYNDNEQFPNVLKSEMEWDRAHDIDKYYHIWEGQCVKHSEAQVFFGKWVIDEFITPENTFYYFGADWGFSKDPSVLVRCFVVDRKLYIDYEFYGVGIDIDLLPIKFKEVPESMKYPCCADSSRPETISYMQRNGFDLMSSSVKGKGSVEDGISFLRGFEKIAIHPRCKHTIDEFKLYCYKVDSQTGIISKKLEDKNNHCIDALRYALEKMMRDESNQAIITRY